MISIEFLVSKFSSLIILLGINLIIWLGAGLSIGAFDFAFSTNYLSKNLPVYANGLSAGIVGGAVAARLNRIGFRAWVVISQNIATAALLNSVYYLVSGDLPGVNISGLNPKIDAILVSSLGYAVFAFVFFVLFIIADERKQ
jgi:hypothetical protein